VHVLVLHARLDRRSSAAVAGRRPAPVISAANHALMTNYCPV
jgi:hypothetical protein